MTSVNRKKNFKCHFQRTLCFFGGIFDFINVVCVQTLVEKIVKKFHHLKEPSSTWIADNIFSSFLRCEILWPKHVLFFIYYGNHN